MKTLSGISASESRGRSDVCLENVAFREGRGVPEPIGRTRVLIDVSVLEPVERTVYVDVAFQAEEVAPRYVQSQASRRVPAFVAMWDAPARASFAREMDWLERHATTTPRALTQS